MASGINTMKPSQEIKEIIIILYIENQENSKNFYSTVLEMNPILDVIGMTVFEISKNVNLGIMTKSGISKIICPVLPHPSNANGIPRCELYLKVDEPREYAKRAINCGGRKVSELSQRDWGDEVVYVSDLDGNVIAFATSIGKD